MKTPDFDAPGMDAIKTWLIDCLKAVPEIASVGRARGFTDEQIYEHLYRNGGRPDMPVEYCKLWQATLQLAGQDPQAWEWLADKPVEAQEWFRDVLLAASGGAAVIRDGSHRMVTRQAIALGIENEADMDD